MAKHYKYVSYEPSGDDSELFQKFCQAIGPIKQNKTIVRTSRDLPSSISATKENHIATREFNKTYDISYLHYVTPESELHYAQPGLRLQTLRDLKRGTLKIEATLDLHHHTIDEAIEKCLHFLREKRCVLIIHGKGTLSKGKPVLKSMLNQWLREQKNVLAFHSAQPKHGGTGALYVLLKRSQHAK